MASPIENLITPNFLASNIQIGGVPQERVFVPIIPHSAQDGVAIEYAEAIARADRFTFPQIESPTLHRAPEIKIVGEMVFDEGHTFNPFIKRLGECFETTRDALRIAAEKMYYDKANLAEAFMNNRGTRLRLRVKHDAPPSITTLVQNGNSSWLVTVKPRDLIHLEPKQESNNRTHEQRAISTAAAQGTLEAIAAQEDEFPRKAKRLNYIDGSDDTSQQRNKLSDLLSTTTQQLTRYRDLLLFRARRQARQQTPQPESKPQPNLVDTTGMNLDDTVSYHSTIPLLFGGITIIGGGAVDAIPAIIDIVNNLLPSQDDGHQPSDDGDSGYFEAARMIENLFNFSPDAFTIEPLTNSPEDAIIEQWFATGIFPVRKAWGRMRMPLLHGRFRAMTEDEQRAYDKFLLVVGVLGGDTQENGTDQIASVDIPLTLPAVVLTDDERKTIRNHFGFDQPYTRFYGRELLWPDNDSDQFLATNDFGLGFDNPMVQQALTTINDIFANDPELAQKAHAASTLLEEDPSREASGQAGAWVGLEISENSGVFVLQIDTLTTRTVVVRDANGTIHKVEANSAQGQDVRLMNITPDVNASPEFLQMVQDVYGVTIPTNKFSVMILGNKLRDAQGQETESRELLGILMADGSIKRFTSTNTPRPVMTPEGRFVLMFAENPAGLEAFLMINNSEINIEDGQNRTVEAGPTDTVRLAIPYDGKAIIFDQSESPLNKSIRINLSQELPQELGRVYNRIITVVANNALQTDSWTGDLTVATNDDIKAAKAQNTRYTLEDVDAALRGENEAPNLSIQIMDVDPNDFSQTEKSVPLAEITELVVKPVKVEPPWSRFHWVVGGYIRILYHYDETTKQLFAYPLIPADGDTWLLTHESYGRLYPYAFLAFVAEGLINNPEMAVDTTGENLGDDVEAIDIAPRIEIGSEIFKVADLTAEVLATGQLPIEGIDN